MSLYFKNKNRELLEGKIHVLLNYWYPRASSTFRKRRSWHRPITSWETDGETVETVSDFIFLGSRITADGNCSHEIKRCLLLGRKVMANLESIQKQDITLPTKVHLVKAMVFTVVTYGCESWTVKKAECWRIEMLLNCGVGQDSWESLGLQGDPIIPFWRRSALGDFWKKGC